MTVIRSGEKFGIGQLNKGVNMTTFNSARDKGKRKHAGRDLYTNPLEPVVAIADGIVLEVSPFIVKRIRLQ